MKRTMKMVLVFLVLFLMLTLAVVLLIPVLEQQISALVNDWPRYVDLFANTEELLNPSGVEP